MCSDGSRVLSFFRHQYYKAETVLNLALDMSFAHLRIQGCRHEVMRARFSKRVTRGSSEEVSVWAIGSS